MSKPTERIIKTNGISLHVVEQGEGPLVLLCHGFPECSYSWRHQIDALARIWPVADNIAQAKDIVDALLSDVGQDRLESLQVAVDVTDNGPFQSVDGLA